MPSELNSDARRDPPDLEGDPSGCAVPGDPKLLAEGWVRKHLVDPDRARESIELYTSLGYEVRAQKLTPADFGPMCKDCASVVCRSYVLIYTRKNQPKNGSDSLHEQAGDT